MLPNFLVCGVQKGGSTSLYHYLRQHPDVFMPEEKEVNFFNDNYPRGRDWYERFFAAAARQRAVGEASPLYIWHPAVPERIASLLPDVKLLLLFRNPLARAHSHYWYNVSRGIQNPTQSFTDAIRSPEGFIRYVGKGFYDEQIERYLSLFRLDQLHVELTEAFHADPLDVLRSCFAFLGVDDAFRPDLARHNVTRIPRSRTAVQLHRAWVPIRKGVRRVLPDVVRTSTRALREQAHRLMFVSEAVPPMSASDRAYLQRLYEPHNSRLSDLLGRDLQEAWQ